MIGGSVNIITPEEVNDLQRLLEDAVSQEQSLTSGASTPWEEKRPLSWSDFHTLLICYCAHRGWELLSDGPGDLSLAIFAHGDKATGEAEALQGRLPFAEEDALPF
jgi:hypothetical protein